GGYDESDRKVTNDGSESPAARGEASGGGRLLRQARSGADHEAPRRQGRGSTTARPGARIHALPGLRSTSEACEALRRDHRGMSLRPRNVADGVRDAYVGDARAQFLDRKVPALDRTVPLPAEDLELRRLCAPSPGERSLRAPRP